MASFIPCGSTRFAVVNTTPWETCDGSMRGFAPSGRSTPGCRSVSSEVSTRAGRPFTAT